MAQPYQYGVHKDARSPPSYFDPKAVTRASWEPTPKKPKQDGPLVNFNRHPDAHMVVSHRSGNYKPLGPRAKKAILHLRRFLLFLRVLQLNGAIGILVLMIMLDKIETISALVMRITPGIIALHSCYGIYHLSRNAAGRAPASSAGYQIFSAITDICALGLYSYSAFTIHSDATGWTTRLPDQNLLEYFIPAVYYTLIGSGGLHFVSLTMALWLAWAFRQISLMPPDMNPLEDHLTARPMHKRNKSSMTTLTSTEGEKRLSTPGTRPQSMARSDVSRPTSIPFMHTRTGSRTSFSTNGATQNQKYEAIRDDSNRDSILSGDTKLPSFRTLPSQQGSYAELPRRDPTPPRRQQTPYSLKDEAEQHPRLAKFTETWAPTDSLISRTNQKNRDAASAMRQSNRNTYTALEQPYYLEDDSDSDYENYQTYAHDSDDEIDLAQQTRHVNPLRLNPPPASHVVVDENAGPFHAQTVDIAQNTEATTTSLSEISHNQRTVSISQDITEQQDSDSSPKKKARKFTPVQTSIGFYSKPYGELKSSTPPIIVGSDRKVSSGNDYDSTFSSVPYGRRNVSGKIAEEGRAGNRYSRFGFSGK